MACIAAAGLVACGNRGATSDAAGSPTSSAQLSPPAASPSSGVELGAGAGGATRGAATTRGEHTRAPINGDGFTPTGGANDASLPPSNGAMTAASAATPGRGESGSQTTNDSSRDGSTATPNTETTPSRGAETTTTSSDSSASSDPSVTGETSSASRDRCDVGVWDGTPPRPLTLSGNTFAHDPTMIEADGVFYRYWTGDGIPSARSTDLLHWENAPAVYTDGYPRWVGSWLEDIPGQTFNFPWAPDVSFFGGKFHIYSSFSAKFGDNISCITHLTSDSPASGNWTDHEPVICTQGHEPYNAIDADVELDAEGNAYLAFGSFWDGIMAFPLNPDGSRKGNDLTRLAWAREIEAPVLLRRCGYYYLFVTWGLCCPGEGRRISDLSYRVAVGRSENVLGPYVDREGRPMLEGGGTLLVQGDRAQWAAAGHSDVLVTGSRIYHYYHAYRQADGQAQLRIVELPFDHEGWPIPAGP